VYSSTRTPFRLVGKVPIDVNKEQHLAALTHWTQDLRPQRARALCMCARKNPRVQLTAIMDGGGHERGMRSGTLNVPGHRRTRICL